MKNQRYSSENMNVPYGRIAGAADIGGTNTRVGLIRSDGTIIRVSRFKTPVQGRSDEISRTIVQVLRELTECESEDTLTGIGVAAAGPLDIRSGTIIHPPNMPFDRVPIGEPIQKATGLPVIVRNDCLAAVLGEVLAGGAQGYDNVVYITISTGIGGGVFTGGRVLTGRGGNASEIGHLPVDNTYIFPCTCGLTGHWEGFASGNGIPVFYREWCMRNGHPWRETDRTPDILQRISEGDGIGRAFLTDLARINGRGFSAVIVAYDPECIILDGTVIRNHPELVSESLAYTDRYLDLPVFRISPLNGDAPLIGAAMAVFHPEMI